MTQPSSHLPDQLLDAHVQHELARFRGEALHPTLDAWVHALFDWCAEVKLDDVATPAQIQGVVDRYVIALRVSGGITELAGEMSQIVFRSPSSAETKVSQIFDEHAYQGFADKVVKLDGVRRELISLVARSEAFGLVTAQLISRTLGELLLGNALTSALGRRLLPAFERRVAHALAGYLAQHRESAAQRSEQHLLEAFDAECVRSIADEIWASVSELPLTDAFLLISEHDLEDFVVLGYEFWLRYRTTSYFRHISEQLIGHFFKKYGQGSLSSLIDEMGVTEQMVTCELSVFLGPLLAHATQTGFLEQQIRAHLEPFYRSQTLAALLRQS